MEKKLELERFRRENALINNVNKFQNNLSQTPIEENQMNITARSYESNYEQNEEMIKNEK